jgi:hypothetical protein
MSNLSDEGNSPVSTLHSVQPRDSCYFGSPPDPTEQRSTEALRNSLPASPYTLALQDFASTKLRLCNPIEGLWYADRPYPTFSIEVVHGDTEERATWLNTCSHGVKLVVSMVDGSGKVADDKLKSSAGGAAPVFSIVEGVSTVRALRFSAVSSKFGGSFNMTISLIHLGSIIATITLLPVRVLSYRLYHSRKVAFENLAPDDSVSKMQGIGSQYAQRFQAIGIETVAQLAALNLRSLSGASTRTLLETLRKDRGTMTLAKLTEYVRQAKTIVSRRRDYA